MLKHYLGIIYRELNMNIKILSINKYIYTLFKTLRLNSPIKWLFYKIDRYFLQVSKEKLKIFSQFIKEGDLSFDIGAWQGEYVEMFLKLGARVIAVEPQQRCVKILKILYGKNRKVKIIGKAVGEKSGRGEIALCLKQTQKATMSSRFRTESRHAKICNWTIMQPVSITTLDSLIQLFGIPKFCKIDVEGFEESVLKGLSYPIPFISFEFHKELLDIVKKCCDLLSVIGKVKYNCIIHSSNSMEKFLFPRWVKEEKLHNELNFHKGKRLSGDIYAKFIKNEN